MLTVALWLVYKGKYEIKNTGIQLYIIYNGARVITLQTTLNIASVSDNIFFHENTHVNEIEKGSRTVL